MGTRGRAWLDEEPPGSVRTGLVCVEVGGFLSSQGSNPVPSHGAGRAVENEGQESVCSAASLLGSVEKHPLESNK